MHQHFCNLGFYLMKSQLSIQKNPIISPYKISAIRPHVFPHFALVGL